MNAQGFFSDATSTTAMLLDGVLRQDLVSRGWGAQKIQDRHVNMIQTTNFRVAFYLSAQVLVYFPSHGNKAVNVKLISKLEY